ncbi:hypothetical protein [Listeria costaricensis]|uniref:hypothetical protein n=1 Tax=Listeria costaricensis TaxID=2026604 RepID=UPI000C07787D|nr:hypothetical protein [Listeria costaricensis]
MKTMIQEMDFAEQLLLHYHTIAHTLKHLTLENQAGFGLTPKQFELLDWIKEEGEMDYESLIREKSKEEAIGRENIKVLIEKGLLILVPVKGYYFVRLTKKGESVIQQIPANSYSIKAFLKLAGELTEQEKAAILMLNQKAAQILRQ